MVMNDADDDDDADKHKFCVILGVGACKYRTDVVEDLFDNPVFNTECDMSVIHLTTLDCICRVNVSRLHHCICRVNVTC